MTRASAFWQGGQCLLDDGLVLHDERMARRHHTKARHAFQLRTLDRDLAVILAGNEQRQNRIDRATAGDDPDVERRRAEAAGHGILASGQLQTGWSVDRSEQRELPELVHDLAAMIRRAQHDDATYPEIGRRPGKLA